MDTQVKCPHYSGVRIILVCVPLFTLKGNLHRIVYKGLFTCREEDPRRRNNFLLGLRVEISVLVVPK